MDEQNELNEQPVKLGFGDLAKVQEYFQLFEELTQADFNANGKPDLMELVSLAQAAFAAEEKFRASFGTLKLVEAVAAFQAFEQEVVSYIEQATTIVSHDIGVFKSKHPGIFKFSAPSKLIHE